MSLKSGHRIIKSENSSILCQNTEVFAHTEFTKLEPNGWNTNPEYNRLLDQFYDFEFRSSDVLVISYPKCGSTWMQEIVWTLLHNPDLDNPIGESLSIDFRCVLLEGDFTVRSMPDFFLKPGSKTYDTFVKLHPDKNPLDEHGIYWQMAELSPDPRCFKSHTPFDLHHPNILEKCKVIYICREPKDMILSSFKFSKIFKIINFSGDLDAFIDNIINDKSFLGNYWAHVKDAWDRRNHKNLLFIHYEDLKADPKKEITRIKDFIGLDRTEAQIDNVVQHTSFEAMKARNNNMEDSKSDVIFRQKLEGEEGGFYNKGQAGSWKERLTPKQVKRIDDWTRDNTKNFDETFKYKIN